MLNFKKLVSTVTISALLMMAGMPFTALAAPSQERIAGIDRYHTAVEISRKGWDKAAYAVLATGEDFPDALCAAPLAKKLDAPILLTGKDKLDTRVASELVRLGVKDVYIIGGSGVVSESVEKEAALLGANVTRIYGNDRYETSVEVAKKLGTSKEVVIATGDNFPDALSIAPVAAQKGAPIILTASDKVPDNVKAYLENINVSKAYIIGGTGVINENVYTQLLNHNPERLWGNDRYETNIAIINRFMDDFDLYKVYLATGRDYPDALSGSALAPKTASPVILTDKNPSTLTKEFVKNFITDESNVTAIGGEGVLSNTTVSTLINAKSKKVVSYTLLNEGSFEYQGVITLSNNGKFPISNITFEIDLGTLNGSSYQREESIEVFGQNVEIQTDDYGSQKAVVKLDTLEGGQTIDYKIVRSFKNAGIKYNTNLSDTSQDYSEFEDYTKYTSQEEKIESTDPEIAKKAAEIVGDEKNPYNIAKKLFEFVNTGIEYDFSEANKGALNALTTRKGVCEDFADLFVAMLRASGVPARVVTGYWVEPENQDNMEDASEYGHAWAEFYLPDYGWVAAEPTVIKTDLEKRIPAFEYFANFNDPGHFVRGYQNELSYSLKYYTNHDVDPDVNITTQEFIKKY